MYGLIENSPHQLHSWSIVQHTLIQCELSDSWECKFSSLTVSGMDVTDRSSLSAEFLTWNSCGSSQTPLWQSLVPASVNSITFNVTSDSRKDGRSHWGHPLVLTPWAESFQRIFSMKHNMSKIHNLLLSMTQNDEWVQKLIRKAVSTPTSTGPQVFLQPRVSPSGFRYFFVLTWKLHPCYIYCPWSPLSFCESWNI